MNAYDSLLQQNPVTMHNQRLEQDKKIADTWVGSLYILVNYQVNQNVILYMATIYLRTLTREDWFLLGKEGTLFTNSFPNLC